MKTSELVTPQHLQLKAVIYIRQSSPHQMISNQESLKLQYALHQRAIDLGWSNENIEIIDSDLGTTATTTEHRTGFKELIASHPGEGKHYSFLRCHSLIAQLLRLVPPPRFMWLS